jgi:hypothetical protein
VVTPARISLMGLAAASRRPGPPSPGTPASPAHANPGEHAAAKRSINTAIQLRECPLSFSGLAEFLLATSGSHGLDGAVAKDPGGLRKANAAMELIGDHVGMIRSLFDLVVPIEATSPEFRHIREYAGFTAGRRLMDEIFAEFRDVDHSFVQQFQTGGFSPRVFELALFAYLKEQGYDLDRSSPAPDFVIRGDVPVAIEVTTSNPSQDADEGDAALSTSTRLGVPDDLPASQREFVFQVGKALRRKLLKRNAAGLAYWEQPHVAGVPFVIALEPFHAAAP